VAKKKQSLNELAKEWNKKLKKSGFNDIEVGGITFKKHKDQPWFNDELTRGNKNDEFIDFSKMEKYRVIGVYAYNSKDIDPLFAKILQHYANGYSIDGAIKKIGVYTYKGNVYKPRTLREYVLNFLKENLPKMIQFYNTLHNEDYINE
jgi:hypothetical protein